MSAVTRREQIKQLVQEQGEASIHELERQFPDFSSMTLRRDLQFLEDNGFLKRTHGGAIAISRVGSMTEELYALRETRNSQGKRAIAQKAIALLEPNRSIYIDSGTTAAYLAMLLPDDPYSVVTSGPHVALELMKKQMPQVTLLGGQLNRTTLSISGPLSMEFVEQLNIDTAIMATSGFSMNSGFTSGMQSENTIKKTVLSKARKVVMLMDYTKLDRAMALTFATLNDIDVLVTDMPLPEEIVEACQRLGVQIL